MKNDCPLFLPSQFNVDNCRMAGLAANSAKVYVADVTVLAWNGEREIFKSVFFIESFDQSAWIAGCEIESLTARHPREAPVQRELLSYLRIINIQEHEYFGTELSPCTARESCEARVTQAYLDARGLQHGLRIGYCDTAGVFRVAVLMSTPQSLQVKPDGAHLYLVRS